MSSQQLKIKEELAEAWVLCHRIPFSRREGWPLQDTPQLLGLHIPMLSPAGRSFLANPWPLPQLKMLVQGTAAAVLPEPKTCRGNSDTCCQHWWHWLNRCALESWNDEHGWSTPRDHENLSLTSVWHAVLACKQGKRNKKQNSETPSAATGCGSGGMWSICRSHPSVGCKEKVGWSQRGLQRVCALQWGPHWSSRALRRRKPQGLFPHVYHCALFSDTHSDLPKGCGVQRLPCRCLSAEVWGAEGGWARSAWGQPLPGREHRTRNARAGCCDGQQRCWILQDSNQRVKSQPAELQQLPDTQHHQSCARSCLFEDRNALLHQSPYRQYLLFL